jgi:acyl-CoA synthetase (AMP-forming)/AMP-acid ligase II
MTADRATVSEKDMLATLTAPGGEFALREYVVNGVLLPVYDRGPHTLLDVFVESRRFGEADAVVYEGEVWSYATLWDRSARLATALHSLYDVAKGDRVAIAMRNYPEWLQSFWASQLLGAVAVPLNAWLAGDELMALIEHCAPRVVVADCERIERLRRRELVDIKLLGARVDGLPGVPSLAELIAQVGPAEPPVCDVGPDDIATIVYTSGTTGRPKGAVATHLNHAVSLLNREIRIVARHRAAEAAGARLPSPADTPQETRLVTYPLFHVAGLTTACYCAFAGHRMLTMYKWDLDKAIDLVERFDVAELSGAPTVVQEMTAAAESNRVLLRSLRVLGCGGASVPRSLAGDIDIAFGGKVSPRTGYGLTETTSGVIAISGTEFLQHPTSIGRPLPGVQTRVVDVNGLPVPRGMQGELEIRSPQVVIGYHDDPAATAASFLDGWFKTGDLVCVDDEGRYYVVGRVKDVVIRAGENINCAEVEACLNAHPAVRESAVIGLPHPTLGEEPAAIVVLDQDGGADAESLREFLLRQLAAFKAPAQIIFSELPLPRTPSGKLIKRGLAGWFTKRSPRS